MAKKKVKDDAAAVVIATEEKDIKIGKGGTIAIDEEDDIEDKEDEDIEDDEEDKEDDIEDNEEDEDDEEDIKSDIKESTDHIIGIVNSEKFHLLEDDIMGVVKSKIREKIDERKQQIKNQLELGER